MPLRLSSLGAPSTTLDTRVVRRRGHRMLDALDLRDAELSIVLCDDATIRALNRDHRNMDRPTDVLAFAIREGPYAEHARSMLGDIVISLDTAARQAREKKVPLDREVTMLLAHGLLHLLGHDHRTRTEERRMTARTDALIAAGIRREIARDRPKSR